MNTKPRQYGTTISGVLDNCKMKKKESYTNYRHTHIRLMALFLGLPGWAGTRKVKPICILLKQETVSGSGISWAICKSAPSSRPITTPTPHHSVFTGRMPFLPPNQQRQSTEGNYKLQTTKKFRLSRLHLCPYKFTVSMLSCNADLVRCVVEACIWCPFDSRTVVPSHALEQMTPRGSQTPESTQNKDTNSDMFTSFMLK